MPRVPRPTNTLTPDSTSEFFEWTYGPPVPKNGLTLAQVRFRARRAWIDGMEAREVGDWNRARGLFFEATQLDGTEPSYHAALGIALMQQGKLVEAEAVVSAAVLLEQNSEEYRRLLAEVRVRRLRTEVRK